MLRCLTIIIVCHIVVSSTRLFRRIISECIALETVFFFFKSAPRVIKTLEFYYFAPTWAQHLLIESTSRLVNNMHAISALCYMFKWIFMSNKTSISGRAIYSHRTGVCEYTYDFVNVLNIEVFGTYRIGKMLHVPEMRTYIREIVKHMCVTYTCLATILRKRKYHRRAHTSHTNTVNNIIYRECLLRRRLYISHIWTIINTGIYTYRTTYFDRYYIKFKYNNIKRIDWVSPSMRRVYCIAV